MVDKICGHCGVVKPLEHCYSDRRSKDGLRSWCKECCSESSKGYNADPNLKPGRLLRSRNYKEVYYADPEKWDKKLQYDKDKYANDPVFREKFKATGKLWRIKNARKIINDKLFASFGITIEDYEKMLAEQNGVCRTCKQNRGKRRLAVDHCHKTGKIRGLLCHYCNTTLGLVKEDIEILNNIKEYIILHQT